MFAGSGGCRFRGNVASGAGVSGVAGAAGSGRATLFRLWEEGSALNYAPAGRIDILEVPEVNGIFGA